MSMNKPQIVHPNKININGHIFEIVTYVPITDDEASKQAWIYYRSHKMPERDKGKIVTRIVTIIGLA